LTQHNFPNGQNGPFSVQNRVQKLPISLTVQFRPSAPKIPFCAFAQTALENSTPEVKQEVLRLLVESIVVEDEAIAIKHIIPTDDNCRLLPRGNMPKPPS
jgi:hypothetical protein